MLNSILVGFRYIRSIPWTNAVFHHHHSPKKYPPFPSFQKPWITIELRHARNSNSNTLEKYYAKNSNSNTLEKYYAKNSNSNTLDKY